jgi:hypothetical protein
VDGCLDVRMDGWMKVTVLNHWSVRLAVPTGLNRYVSASSHLRTEGESVSGTLCLVASTVLGTSSSECNQPGYLLTVALAACSTL